MDNSPKGMLTCDRERLPAWHMGVLLPDPRAVKPRSRTLGTIQTLWTMSDQCPNSNAPRPRLPETERKRDAYHQLTAGSAIAHLQSRIFRPSFATLGTTDSASASSSPVPGEVTRFLPAVPPTAVPWSSLSLSLVVLTLCSEEFTELVANVHITHPRGTAYPPFLSPIRSGRVTPRPQRPTLHFGAMMAAFLTPGNVTSVSPFRLWAYIYARYSHRSHEAR